MDDIVFLNNLHKTKNVRFIFSDHLEIGVNRKLSPLVEQLNVPAEHIVHIHNIETKLQNLQTHQNVRFVDWWPCFVYRMFLKQYKLSDINRSNVGDKGLFFVGKPHKVYRLSVLAHLYKSKMLDKFIWSLYMNDQMIHDCYDLVSDIMTHEEYISDFIPYSVKALDNVKIQIQKSSLHCDGFPFDIELFNRTKFSLVSETHPNIPYLLSEKTYKPLLMKHPFISFVHNDDFSRLQSMGYETYHSRPLMFYNVEEANYMLNIVDSMFDNDMSDIAEHNHNTFLSHVEKAEQEIIDLVDTLFNPS